MRSRRYLVRERWKLVGSILSFWKGAATGVQFFGDVLTTAAWWSSGAESSPACVSITIRRLRSCSSTLHWIVCAAACRVVASTIESRNAVAKSTIRRRYCWRNHAASASSIGPSARRRSLSSPPQYSSKTLSMRDETSDPSVGPLRREGRNQLRRARLRAADEVALEARVGNTHYGHHTVLCNIGAVARDWLGLRLAS